MKTDKKIGFIGAGNMAEAFICGLVNKIFPENQIQISEPDADRMAQIQKKYKITTAISNTELFQNNDIVVLAVKPQVMKTVLYEIQPNHVNNHCLMVSIAAGVTIETISQIMYHHLNSKSSGLIPIVRVMPNTPALIQYGMSAYCGNEFASQDDMNLVSEILSALGRVIAVSENQMDAITAVSGSGPAYLFYFVESMIQGAQNLGFTEDQSRLLVMQTIDGALQLLKQPDACPIKLREQVTSKGGTTEAAVEIFQNRNLKNAVIDAMNSASRRAQELSQM